MKWGGVSNISDRLGSILVTASQAWFESVSKRETTSVPCRVVYSIWCTTGWHDWGFQYTLAPYSGSYLLHIDILVVMLHGGKLDVVLWSSRRVIIFLVPSRLWIVLVCNGLLATSASYRMLCFICVWLFSSWFYLLCCYQFEVGLVLVCVRVLWVSLWT